MSTTTDPSPQGLLSALLDLTALARGELGDLAVAYRILKVLESQFPQSDPRVALIEGARLMGFAPARKLESSRPLRLGTVDLSPLVQEWMRTCDPSLEPELWPQELRDVLELDTPRLQSVPLCGSIAPVGFIGVHTGPLDPAERERLEVIAAHAAIVTENSRWIRRLEQEAETDGLTNAYNYRFYMRALDHEMERVRRRGGSLTVVMVDVDNLKEYNDRFGHLGGSAALKEVSGLLLASSRSIDIVAKYGGDEFSLLLPDCGLEGAELFCDRLGREIAAYEFEGDPERRLTVSMGIAVFPDEGSDPRDLLRRADARLYDAKRAGRNRLGSPS